MSAVNLMIHSAREVRTTQTTKAAYGDGFSLRRTRRKAQSMAEVRVHREKFQIIGVRIEDSQSISDPGPLYQREGEGERL